MSLKPSVSGPQYPDFASVFIVVLVYFKNNKRVIEYKDFWTDHDKNLDFVIYVWRRLAPELIGMGFHHFHLSCDGCSRQFKRFFACFFLFLMYIDVSPIRLQPLCALLLGLAVS